MDDSVTNKFVQIMILGWALTFIRQGQIHLYAENVEKSFSQNVLKINGWHWQCMNIILSYLMIKVVKPFSNNQISVPRGLSALAFELYTSQWIHDIYKTSSHDVASTLRRRCIDVMCLLGCIKRNNKEISFSLKPFDLLSPDFTWGLMSKGYWYFFFFFFFFSSNGLFHWTRWSSFPCDNSGKALTNLFL